MKPRKKTQGRTRAEMEPIHEKIKELIEDGRYSNRKIAEMVGCSAQTVSAARNKQPKLPIPEMIYRGGDDF